MGAFTVCWRKSAFTRFTCAIAAYSDYLFYDDLLRGKAGQAEKSVLLAGNVSQFAKFIVFSLRVSF
jgi:hypothetical protein